MNIHTTTDPKIDRIHSSVLGLSREQAAWLASVADEVPAPAGSRIGHRRFAQLVLDGADAGLLVGAGEPPAVLRDNATVLVLTRSDAAALLTAMRSRAATVTRFAATSLRHA